MFALSDPSAGDARPEVNLTVGITITEAGKQVMNRASRFCL
jgi:hypothetical protein